MPETETPTPTQTPAAPAIDYKALASELAPMLAAAARPSTTAPAAPDAKPAREEPHPMLAHPVRVYPPGEHKAVCAFVTRVDEENHRVDVIAFRAGQGTGQALVSISFDDVKPL